MSISPAAWMMRTSLCGSGRISVLASVVPQRSTDIAVVLQLTEDHDDDGCEWLVKVEWAIVDDDGYADYRRFFIDDGFAPNLLLKTAYKTFC